MGAEQRVGEDAGSRESGGQSAGRSWKEREYHGRQFRNCTRGERNLLQVRVEKGHGCVDLFRSSVVWMISWVAASGCELGRCLRNSKPVVINGKIQSFSSFS